MKRWDGTPLEIWLPKQWRPKPLPLPNLREGPLGVLASKLFPTTPLWSSFWEIKTTILFIHLFSSKITLCSKTERANSSPSKKTRTSVLSPCPLSNIRKYPFPCIKRNKAKTHQGSQSMEEIGFLGHLCYSCAGLFEEAHVNTLCLSFFIQKRRRGGGKKKNRIRDKKTASRLDSQTVFKKKKKLVPGPLKVRSEFIVLYLNCPWLKQHWGRNGKRNRDGQQCPMLNPTLSSVQEAWARSQRKHPQP